MCKDLNRNSTAGLAGSRRMGIGGICQYRAFDAEHEFGRVGCVAVEHGRLGEGSNALGIVPEPNGTTAAGWYGILVEVWCQAPATASEAGDDEGCIACVGEGESASAIAAERNGAVVVDKGVEGDLRAFGFACGGQ